MPEAVPAGSVAGGGDGDAKFDDSDSHFYIFVAV